MPASYERQIRQRSRGHAGLTWSDASGGRPEVPLAGYALEHLGATVVEPEIRSDHEVLHGVGDQHLARTRQRPTRAPMCTPMPGDVVTAPLDLTRVQSGTDFDAQWTYRVADSERGPNSSPGPSKVASSPSPVRFTTTPRCASTALAAYVSCCSSRCATPGPRARRPAPSNRRCP